MSRAALIAVGVILLALTMFASPFDGNILGFCPISEGPKAVGVDAVVAAIDAVGLWLIYRGIRA
jgi:hypothetical protein